MTSHPPDDEAVSAVYEALEQMTIEQRMVFSLRFISQMTVREIAAAMSLSTSTVKRRLSVAREVFDTIVADDPRLAGWVHPQGGAS